MDLLLYNEDLRQATWIDDPGKLLSFLDRAVTTSIAGFLATLSAYLAGSVAFFRFSRRRGFSSRDSAWLLFAGLAGGLVGAKIVRLLFATAAGADPVSLLVHPQGRTIIGGILCGWWAVESVKKRLRIERSTGDGFAFTLSLGEAIGRIGCYFNGCCYGAAAAVPWAVYQAGAWRHPTQLYSSAVALAIFLTLLLVSRRARFEGTVFRVYVLLYAASRFSLDFLRERSESILGLSIPQWICLELVLALLAVFVMSSLKRRKGGGVPEPDEPL